MPISSAVSPSAVARVVGVQTLFKDLRAGNIAALPQRIAVIGQGNSLASYSTDKATVASALAVAQEYGFGSPLHLAVLKLLPVNGDGVGSIPVTVYPLVDDAGGAPSEGDIVPGGASTATGTYIVRVNNIDSIAFTVTASDAVAVVIAAMIAAVNGVLEMPVIASDGTTTTTFTSKWEGTSANDIFLEVIPLGDGDETFAVTQPISGAANPDVDDALVQIGNVWETLLVNCMDVADTATLDKYSSANEARWGALVHKPFVAFSGETAAAVATAIAVPDVRTSDRTNAQLVAPGSNDLPFVVAARQVARIAIVANANPPHDYGSQDATGLTPGTDAEQWDYAERDQAVKAGSSTIEVDGGVVNISDVVTMYHPLGDPLPAYRFVVDIVRLQNILFNIAVTFNTPEWDGAPLIPDDQPTSNRSARKPKTAKAAAAALVDSLALNAILSDPETSKAGIVAEIDPGNSKRLNLLIPVSLSGNTNIVSIDLEWGFFFSTPAIVV